MAKIPQDSIVVKCWLFEHSDHAIIHTCNRVILIICIHACMLNIKIRWQLNDDQRQQKKSSKLQQKWPRIEKAILTVWFPLLRRYVHYRQVWNRVSSSFEFQVRLDFFNGSYQNSEQSHQKNCNFLASQVIFQS